MRLILEKSEVVAILGKHFDVELDPEKVIIKTDPFEIEVSGLPMTDAPPREENVVAFNAPARRAAKERVEAPKEEVRQRDDPDASDEPPPPGRDGSEGSDEAVHPASVLATSKALEAQLDRENPKLARRSGRWSDIAPTSQDDEV
jgi:hypothetical protein